MQLEDEFGDIIRKARLGHGYSLDEVSSLSGIQVYRLANFESCQLKPTCAEAKAISAALGLDGEKLWDIAEAIWTPKPEPWNAEPGVVIRVAPVDVDGYSENCYVLGCARTRKAVVVDPGGAMDVIAGVVSDAGLAVEAIAITHGHPDHTAGATALAGRLGIRDIFAHPEDLWALGDLSMRHVADGDEFRIGDLDIRTLHTPGHTRGSVCYLTGHICSVGDTLFAGSVGNAAGGPEGYRSLVDSVRTKLLSLPAETAILPGHGPATTVAEELEHNPFF